jgi:deoxyribose-phosphate aldolase
LRDTAAILGAGGDEVDLVLPYRAFASGDHAQSAAVVAAVRRASEGKLLKLIIESGELKDAALIRAASQLGLDSGVDFLKTSTGKTPVSATLQAAREMLQVIAMHPRGKAVGFKASGGIRKVGEAAGYIALTREILGEGALTPQRLRFGASGLLADVEAVLSGTEIPESSKTAY